VTEWLAGSGITVDGGVLCDGQLRAHGATDVFAVGDVARYPHPGLGRTVRSEHWTNAVDQARHVAQVIVRDTAERYEPTDYVWSDQYDWKVQVAGQRANAAAEWVVGDQAGERPQVMVAHADAAGQLCAVVCLNWPRAFLQCRRLLDERASAVRARDLLAAL